MRTHIITLLHCASILVAAGGCATQRVSTQILQEMTPSREFIPNKEYEGKYVGLVKHGGRRYHKFQFPHALKSNHARILTLLVPSETHTQQWSWQNQFKVGMMRDSDPVEEGGFPVTLNVDPGVYPPWEFGGGSPEIRPSRESSQAYQALMTSPDQLFLWLKDRSPGGVSLVRKIEGRELSYCLMEDRLKYVERDRSKIRNMRLAWFWTVPVDLITCPFQAFVYVVFMISGAP